MWSVITGGNDCCRIAVAESPQDAPIFPFFRDFAHNYTGFQCESFRHIKYNIQFRWNIFFSGTCGAAGEIDWKWIVFHYRKYIVRDCRWHATCGDPFQILHGNHIRTGKH